MAQKQTTKSVLDNYATENNILLSDYRQKIIRDGGGGSIGVVLVPYRMGHETIYVPSEGPAIKDTHRNIRDRILISKMLDIDKINFEPNGMSPWQAFKGCSQ